MKPRTRLKQRVGRQAAYESGVVALGGEVIFDRNRLARARALVHAHKDTHLVVQQLVDTLRHDVHFRVALVAVKQLDWEARAAMRISLGV
jgi:hypothetical protein